MKAPLKWLRDYVDVTLPPADIADRLTMAGAEVKELKVIGGNWDNVFVAKILAINPHPNADRLRLVTVDLGTSQETVVCGAPNLTLGDKIAFARVGATLLDGHTGKVEKLKPARIRGVLSAGMVVSEMELGISENHEGILVLPPDAPIGKPLAELLGDAIFDLDVTPNRADCLSVIGIAREIAALSGQKPHVTEPAYAESGAPIDGQIAVEIADAELCPRYCASLLTGVKIAESPRWMQERLIACGMRPINNVVDITNYVMLEYGQPLHAFDYRKIVGQKIIVRRAAVDEVIVSLDGTERKLAADMLVIADAARAVAVAGVMGGANSEVGEGTTVILLESANFKAVSIHYTSRRLQLVSEASMRFERGIQPGLTIPALKRATQLMVELAGAQVAKGIADVYPGKRERETIKLSTGTVNRLLGTAFKVDEVAATLTSLCFDCKTVSETEVAAGVPYWRGDIQREVDLVEEVARIAGYDKIPMTMLAAALPPQDTDPLIPLKRRMAQYLVGYGLQEVVTYSLSSLDSLQKLDPEGGAAPMTLKLANPMTADQEYLRPNLRANLLNTLRENRRHEDGGISLFELGKVYLPHPPGLPAEPETLCALFSGRRSEKSWLTGEDAFDFFDAKGAVEALLGQLGIAVIFEPSADKGLHPANQSAIVANGARLGIVGEVHPRVLDSFEIAGHTFIFEIDVNALVPLASAQKMYQPVARFPSVVRDIALVVDASVTHRSVLDIIRGFPLVNQVTLFDVYSGEKVAAGKKSLAYHIVYQSDHTLTDDEVNGVQQKVLDELAAQLGATLRS